jgi:hypothetical protein
MEIEEKDKLRVRYCPAVQCIAVLGGHRGYPAIQHHAAFRSSVCACQDGCLKILFKLMQHIRCLP